MAVITEQSWWDDNKTPAQNEVAMEAYLVANYDPHTLSDNESDILQKFRTQLGILKNLHTKKVIDFNTAKDVDFAAMRDTQTAERTDKTALWLAREANDYNTTTPATISG